MDFINHDEDVESIIEKHRKLQEEVLALDNSFVKDVQKRTKQMDTKYLTGLT